MASGAGMGRELKPIVRGALLREYFEKVKRASAVDIARWMDYSLSTAYRDLDALCASLLYKDGTDYVALDGSV